MSLRDVGGADDLPEITGYKLLRAVNRGGMSTVYLARQLTLDREVAVKVVRQEALEDETSRRRFENEVRTIARLDHPHIVRIYEVGRTRDGRAYFTMPYMAGGHLGKRRFSRGGVVDEAAVATVVRAMLDALEYAHARGVIHRDVKAENVLFDERDRPMLADFGVALRRGFGARVTTSGLAIGSTAYMAPEQARGEDVDGRVDLYSLGVLTFEMLTGRLPFEARDALSMAVKHVRDPIPALPEDIRHWQRFVHQAMAKRAGRRFANAAEMRAALDEVERGRGQAVGAPWRRRVAAFVAIAGIGIAAAWGWSRSGAEPAVAQVAPERSAAIADPMDAMLAPPPEAPLQRALGEARMHLDASRLIAPADANAYISTLSAWHVDSASPDVHRMIGDLTAALGREVARALRAGDEDRAFEYFESARALGVQTGSADSPAQQQLRERVVDAVRGFVAAQAPLPAERVQAVATRFELPAATARTLVASVRSSTAKALATSGVAPAPERGGFQMASKPVSRAEYARFAEATKRAPALCRERASLLRVLAPRTWITPGFAQGEGEPVVCVSQRDAEAYAEWYSRQSGHAYRLPSAAQAKQRPADVAGRDIALWLRDCGTNCEQRQASGTSWRSKQATRALSAARGYDDVGFRLVRED